MDSSIRDLGRVFPGALDNKPPSIFMSLCSVFRFQVFSIQYSVFSTH